MVRREASEASMRPTWPAVCGTAGSGFKDGSDQSVTRSRDRPEQRRDSFRSLCNVSFVARYCGTIQDRLNIGELRVLPSILCQLGNVMHRIVQRHEQGPVVGLHAPRQCKIKIARAARHDRRWARQHHRPCVDPRFRSCSSKSASRFGSGIPYNRRTWREARDRS